MIKGQSIKKTTILNVYVPSDTGSKYMRQKLVIYLYSLIEKWKIYSNIAKSVIFP